MSLDLNKKLLLVRILVVFWFIVFRESYVGFFLIDLCLSGFFFIKEWINF